MTDARVAAPANPWTIRFASALFVVMWCSGYPAARISLEHAGPFTTLFWRFVAAAVIFGVLAPFARAARPEWRTLARSAIVGVLSLAVSFGGVYEGMRLGVSSGVAALIIGALPLSTALFASIIGTRLDRWQWFGLVLGFVGVALVLASHLQGGGRAIGYVLCFVGLAGLSVGTLYQKRHSDTIDLRIALAVQHVAAALVMLPLAWSLEGFHADWSTPYLGALAWITVVNAVGGFALMFWLLRRGTATDVTALFYLMPPITALMGYVMFGERLTATMLPGFVLVAIGVWLGTRGETKRVDSR